MKRVKHDCETCEHDDHGEPGFGGIGEKHYVDSYRDDSVLTAVGVNWATSTRFDPTSTVDLGGGAVATPLNLCSPSVGSNVDQRVGRAIRICKVTLRGVLDMPDDSDTGRPSGEAVRVLLVLDQHTNGAQLTAADVLNDGNGNFSTLGSFSNPNGHGRFVILRDKMMAINYSTSQSTAGMIGKKKVFKLKYKWPEGLLVRFNSTAGGTVTSVITNSLHVLAGRDESVTNFITTLAYTCRVEYYNVEPLPVLTC